jgi:hypothetical protein
VHAAAATGWGFCVIAVDGIHNLARAETLAGIVQVYDGFLPCPFLKERKILPDLIDIHFANFLKEIYIVGYYTFVLAERKWSRNVNLLWMRRVELAIASSTLSGSSVRQFVAIF